MESELRLLNYIASVPPSTSADEFKDQLGAYNHDVLRAVCSRLGLALPRKDRKKSNYIATLVKYWSSDLTETPNSPARTTQPKARIAQPKAKLTHLKATRTQPKANLPHHPMPMHEASDVTKFVQDFSPNGDIQELRDQLNECRAVILRSACVLLELRPYRKHFTKPNHVTLLVEYWQDTVKTINERENPPSVSPKAAQVPERRDEVVEVTPKATQVPEQRDEWAEVTPKAAEVPDRRDERTEVAPEAAEVPERRDERAEVAAEAAEIPERRDERAEVASNAAQAPEVPPKAVEAPEPHFVPLDEGVRLKKRTREEVKEKPEKKKTKGLERNGNIFKEKPGAMAKSLEKAKVVKEWASAIEILSRVDGGADSITSIRALIDDVVESAADIRTDKLE